MGKIELRKWTFHDKENLMAICNAVNRSYLSNRLPFPYTESDAKWWLDMVEEHDGKDGIFPLNRNQMFMGKMRKSATCLLRRNGRRES